MILSLLQQNGPALLDEHNFRALKVQAHANSPTADVMSVLGRFGVLEGEHVWLSIEKLKGLGPDQKAWKDGFDAMIAFAAKAGWVSQAGDSVRAHMEWIGGL